MPLPLVENGAVRSALDLLQAWIESQMEYRQLPGLSIALVSDQEVFWSKGFGMADPETGTAASPETIYRIASISKLFTATALLQLRDRSLLNLDDPVNRYLSWFKIRNRHKNTRAITIRHLLTHTSGLPRESAFPYWTDFEFPTREQMMEALPHQETVFPPETRWKYSNLALALAGEIVAEVSGESYAEYIHRHILDPLEMASTSVHLPEDHTSRLAAGYSRRMPDGSRERRPFTHSRGLTPAANLSSTVLDMARFVALQFRGGPAKGPQILKGSTLREMHRVHWLKPDWSGGWGLGFNIERRNGRVLIGHGGNVAGYATKIAFCLEEKFGVIVMTNADDGNPENYRDRTFSLAAPAVRKARKTKKSHPAPDPRWKAYVGKYRNVWGDCRVLILNGRLCLIEPTSEDPVASLCQLKPEGEQVFRIEGDAGYAEIGELAIFELDENGKVIRLKIGENSTWPVEDNRSRQN